MKVVIIGGVAGGATTAARLRRLDEHAEIVILEKGNFISYANCGLPYFVGGTIEDREDLELQTPASFHARFAVDVRARAEAVKIDTAAKTVTVKNLDSGEETEEAYDNLVIAPGASAKSRWRRWAWALPVRSGCGSTGPRCGNPAPRTVRPAPVFPGAPAAPLF